MHHRLRTLLILLVATVGCVLVAYGLNLAAVAACDWVWNWADKSLEHWRIHPGWFRL